MASGDDRLLRIFVEATPQHAVREQNPNNNLLRISVDYATFALFAITKNPLAGRAEGVTRNWRIWSGSLDSEMCLLFLPVNGEGPQKPGQGQAGGGLPKHEESDDLRGEVCEPYGPGHI